MTETATEPQAQASSVFQAARDRAAAAAMPGSFMTKEERQEFFTTKTPFWLIAAKLAKSQFGDQVHYVIVTDPETAENGEFKQDVTKVLALDYSEFRDKLATELNALIATQKVVGPLYLDKFKTTSGHEAWDLTDVVPDEIPY